MSMARASVVLLGLLLLSAAAGSHDVTEPSRRAADRALQWLLRAQNRDGSWGLDRGTPPEPSCTVMAALALMSAGHTGRGGPDPDCVRAVRRAVEYILQQGRRAPNGVWGGQVTLVQGKLGQHIHTFFATVLLSQILGMQGPWVQRDEVQELRDLISVFTDRIARTQEADGSWHKEMFGSLKATCMAWLALRAAHSSGLNVQAATVEKTIRFIKKQFNPQTRLFDRFTGQGNYQAIYATASCLRVLYAMGEGDSPEAVAATEAFLNFVKTGQMGAVFLTVEGEDYLSAALVSQALLPEDGKRWKAWFPWIREQLLKRQNADGSWTTTACISGKTFATAGALLTLQAPYRLLPIQEQ